MMSDLTVLREKNPALAEFVQAWESKYQRAYDLSEVGQQADFYEGVLEMARHIAKTNSGANLRVGVSTTGVSELLISTSSS